MRWLPYPTCRLPLRRFISLTLAFALSGAPAVVRAESNPQQPVTVTPGVEYLCMGLSLDAKGEVPDDAAKFKQWRNYYNRENFSKEHRLNPLDAPRAALQQVIITAKKEAEPNIPEAAARQNQFLEDFIRNTRGICAVILKSESSLKDLQQRLNEQDKGATSEKCVFEKAESFYSQANVGFKQFDEVFGRIFTITKETFAADAEYNYKAVQLQQAASDGVPLAERNEAKMRVSALQKERQNLWGDNATPDELAKIAKGQSYDFRIKFLFSGMVKTMENQKMATSASQQNLERAAQRMGALKLRCGNGNGAKVDPANPQASTKPAPETPGATTTTTQGDVQDSSTEGNCSSQVGWGVVGVQGTNCKGADVKTTGLGDDRPLSGTKRNDETKTREEDEEKTDETKRKPRNENIPVPEKKEESWVSKNSDLLIMGGVGAAAVGGLIYYLKTEDDKKKDKANDMELEAAAAAMTQQQQASNNSSSSSSSSDGSTDSFSGGAPAAGQTPQGSTLMVEGTPAGASANQTISSFVVKVVGPNGVMTQDSSTDITVSCMTPVPCGLEGTLTVNTDGGKAEFKDIRLKTPNSGVRLQFNAPGFQSVGSSSFDVSSQ